MKKVLLFLFLFTSFIVKAEGIRYQGEVQAGFGVGIGDNDFHRVNIHTVHGVRVNEYFFAGVGVGMDFYLDMISIYEDYLATEFAIPIFFSPKGYLPVSDNVDLFLGVDAGISLGLSDLQEFNSYFFTPHIGASIKLGGKKAINMSLGYHCQKFSLKDADDYYYDLSFNADALQIKLGFMF